jgi:tetratricopeptide (TPR) repeat protein
MKKSVVTAALLLITIAVFCQPNRVVNAYNYLKSGQLDKAKENIDLAIEHPKTQGEPKTWLYRGNVYLAIALTEEEKFQNLHPEPLIESYNAYQKSIEIDKDYIQPTANPPSAKLGLFIIGEQHYNKGVEYFNNQDFNNAIIEFEKTKKINNIFQIKDSLATFNAAICAIQIEDNDKAIQFLRELITMNYDNPLVFSYLATLYNEKGETEKAMQVIKGGKTKFPDDLNIIIAETNLYLATGDIENAQKTLAVAIEKDPNNALLYFTVGSNYDQMSRGEDVTDEDRAVFMEESEKAYLKAIEIRPDYFDAYYNLGALYYNEGVRIFELADEILDMKEYAKYKEKFDSMWNKAVPYLEKAHEIDPGDIFTLQSLRILYARLSMTEKHYDADAKLKKLLGE